MYTNKQLHVEGAAKSHDVVSTLRPSIYQSLMLCPYVG